MNRTPFVRRTPSRRTPIRHKRAGRAALLAVVMLLAAACGDDSGDGSTPTDSVSTDTTAATTTAPGTTAPIPDEGTALVDVQLNVVEFGDAGYVEVVNNGNDAASLAGIHLCQSGTCVDIGTVVSDTVEPGATAQVPGDSVGGLGAAGGEAALFNSDSYDSSDAVLSYVQWAEGGHAAAAVAVEAGLWPTVDDFVTPDPAYPNIESGGFAADPEGWS